MNIALKIIGMSLTFFAVFVHMFFLGINTNQVLFPKCFLF